MEFINSFHPLPSFPKSQDDGEMYDEFGNLKKKFRAKTQQIEASQSLPGVGRAGWEVEELGIILNGVSLFIFIS